MKLMMLFNAMVLSLSMTGVAQAGWLEDLMEIVAHDRTVIIGPGGEVCNESRCVVIGGGSYDRYDGDQDNGGGDRNDNGNNGGGNDDSGRGNAGTGGGQDRGNNDGRGNSGGLVVGDRG